MPALAQAAGGHRRLHRDACNEQDTTYGPELQEAVKRFQRRHGLEPDGAVGAAVVAQMNVPVEERIRQIALNLERWRWLPRDLGERHILVNIPNTASRSGRTGSVPLCDARRRRQEGHADADLQRRDDARRLLALLERAARHRQERDDAVGAARPGVPRSARTWKWSTRAATRSIRRRSTWTTPAAYRFRQRPGSSNSLGLVKFMFPNSFNVYLHDTPADSLFARATRSFSHGCVRVEQPEQLAQYVLGDQPEWTPERIARGDARRRRRRR